MNKNPVGESFAYLMAGGRVRRYHTAPVREQSVAAHSWGVAAVLMAAFPGVSGSLLRAALLHDVHEHKTGDIPAPAKWEHEGFSKALEAVEIELEMAMNTVPQLTKQEAALLKWADALELVSHCLYDAERGNALALPVALAGVRCIRSLELVQRSFFTERALKLSESFIARVQAMQHRTHT
jgi:5'-deoxynucleotidase YfbR-like HD superfamily hydrolase